MENKIKNKMLMVAVMLFTYNMQANEFTAISPFFDIGVEEKKLQQIGQELGALQDSSVKRKRPEESENSLSDSDSSDSQEGLHEVASVTPKEWPIVRDEEGKIVCQWPGCVIKVASRSAFEQHMRTHTGESPFVCGDCGDAFKKVSNLRRHALKHKKEKDYKCYYDGCGKTFTRLDTLQAHKRKHTKVSPYKCDDCNRTFTLRGGLNSHMENKVCQKNKIGGVNGN